jgi:hypothetical protein
MENTLKFCQANTKQISGEKATIPFTLTTFSVDRDGDVIFPTGGILTNFRKNPISLFMHNAFDVPPAKLLPDSIQSNTQEMTGNVQFDVKNDPFAEFLFKKFESGFLNAGSIRFIPIEFDKEMVLDGQTGFAVKVWELIEFSLVTIPANPEALRKEYKDGNQGLYQKHEQPYYSAIKRFYEYHNRNLDVDKQVFSFCVGEGCKDLLTGERKTNIGIDNVTETIKQEIESSPNIAENCKCKQKEYESDIIEDEKDELLVAMYQILKKIESKLPPQKDKKEQNIVSERQFLEILEALNNSKEAEIG